MPELPEVENVCRTLRPLLEGARCQRVTIHRRDVLHGSATSQALLGGQHIHTMRRHGKQMAMIGEDGRLVCLHLGMTGSLVARPAGRGRSTDPHEHVRWQLCGRDEFVFEIVFRDPRRFGGVWTFDCPDTLHAARWSNLGPDALTIKPMELHRRLRGTQRAVKAAMLDQTLVAGLGNIYVDELLFRCRQAPTQPANTIPQASTRTLVNTMRRLLMRAIASGGSSVRDYVNGQGVPGAFQRSHAVYGRGGQPCRRCGRGLATTVLAGRTTVFCETCQSQDG